ncbi:nucleoside 2-deoxyribosyltransferase [Rhodopila sp.]|jgi:nucleoside 2-deoxyribosyltransferase|uniref:nucleoside 2-deoxyribosyltransferase n=1 Tax=Rhodopila sp. TaxID=2480087 RepID=UPI002CB68BF7|nr:nucleoside 2-deoxyribosyltransferase [Rhodopila sp.]HVZ07575.1 nucleoside 2-deoxyribosyltransferase [Rhodopila sp.]
MSIRVYLAGPDVFLPEPAVWLDRKKAICAGHGLTGVSPLDALAGEPARWTSLPAWRRIALCNEAHIRGCDALLANLTPFRGPSADAGTIYEVGFARALGLKLFGYATVAAPFLDRTIAHLDGAAAQAEDGSWRDPDGLQIEQFGLFDNLMIEGGIHGSGGMLLREDADSRWYNLGVFERCVRMAAEMLVGVAG